jgi:peptidoglycan/xylan/chitin deacetylase (PgdA/CDA1 family)
VINYPDGYDVFMRTIPSKRIFTVFFALLVVGVILTIRANAAPATDTTLRHLRVPILMYHYISAAPDKEDKLRVDLSVPPEMFRQQMQWLKDNGYTTITPDDLADALTEGKKLPAKPILLTFDDGYIDAYMNAFQILKEFGFTGTFFVVTKWINNNSAGYINWDQAREMVKGGMVIQNHSYSHFDMGNRDHDWLIAEIVQPTQDIEKNIGIRPRFFCYPSGKYDNATIRELRAAGYVAAFTVNDGTYEVTDNMFRVPRVRIRGEFDLKTFGERIAWVR